MARKHESHNSPFSQSNNLRALELASGAYVDRHLPDEVRALLRVINADPRTIAKYGRRAEEAQKKQ